ncbi:MAG: mechanosensitive ion channel family protein [Methanobacteriota archaeon]
MSNATTIITNLTNTSPISPDNMVIMTNATNIVKNLTNISALSPDITETPHLIDIIFNPFWIIQSLIILIFAYIAVWLLDLCLKFLSEQLGTKRHVLAMAIPVVKIIIYLGAFYLIVSPLLHLGLTEFAVFSGIMGAGLGLGLKDLFADIVAGFVIVIEKPYQIGDKIQVGNDYGEVVDIGMVQTIIITPGDSRVSIPNYSAISNSVSSANAGSAEMMVIIDLYLSYDSDIQEAIRLLSEAVITSRYVYVSDTRPYTILVENLPLFRKITAKAYVNDLRHEFIFKTDITKRAWEAYQKAGIKAPDISAGGYCLTQSLPN